MPSNGDIDGPKAIAASASRVAVADVSGVTLFENGKKLNTVKVKEGCSAVALHQDVLAYGGPVSSILKMTLERVLNTFSYG